MSKVAIVGTRNPLLTFDEWEERYIKTIMKYNPTTIVSGGAKGIDAYARQFAENHGIQLIEIKPDYNRFHKLAPILRNTEIVNNSEVVLAFPSKESKGTWDTIRKGNKQGKQVEIINI